MNPTSLIRLNKYIAESGLCSRRKADQLIKEGQVKINGTKARSLGLSIDPSKDKITVGGKSIQPEASKFYIAFNKPKNVVSTMSDPKDRECLGDYFSSFDVRLYPIGRLDWDSEGLMILTNDGTFAQKVAHPSYEVFKTYIVKLDRAPKDNEISKLLKGVSIIGGKVKAREVTRIKRGSNEKPWYRISVSEGKNRQIRRMFEKINCDVIKLQRVSIGGLRLGSLDKGEFKLLKINDIDKIFKEFPTITESAESKTFSKRPTKSKKKKRISKREALRQ